MSLTSFINNTFSGIGDFKPTGLGTIFQRDPFAPNFELLHRGGLGAQPVIINDTVTRFIDEISWEDNADQFDVLTLSLSNQADESGGGDILSLMDSKLFAEGSFLEVRMGYGRSLRTIGVAEIVTRTPSFDKGGATLTIECYDLLHRAARNRPKGGVPYKGFRDSQIASIIGARNGFDIKTADPRSFSGIRRTSGKFDRTQKKGVSDYEFLKKIAKINGFDLWSAFNTELKKFSLFFQPNITKKQREVFSFKYNDGEISHQNALLSFNPTLDASDQSTDFEIFTLTNKEVGGTSVNFIKRLTLENQKKVIEQQKTRFTGGNVGPQGGKQTPNDDGVQVGFNAFGRSFKFPPHKRFKTEAEARKAIEEFIKRQKENFITGDGEIRGNEALQARQIHNLLGITEQFSGKYYFSKVKHTQRRGEPYVCTFSCRKLIEDTVVQSSPTITLSTVDKRVEKFKGLSSVGRDFNFK